MLTYDEMTGSDRPDPHNEDAMMTILPVGDPVIFDGTEVPFEDLPFTSWIVDDGTGSETEGEIEPAYLYGPDGERLTEDELDALDREVGPLDPTLIPDDELIYTILPVGEPVILEGEPVPFEDLPFTSWVVDEDGTPISAPEPGTGEEAEIGITAIDVPVGEGDVAITAIDVPVGEGDVAITAIDVPVGDGDVAITGDADDTADTASIEAAVGRLYEVALGREADADGLTFWSGVVADGADIADVADAFADAFFFDDEVGDALDDEEFVAGLYQNGLGREADADGAAFWLDLLDEPSIDRGDLLMAFADAEEVHILG
ncbi:MAG: DUF4214 domain-containing protein [Pseudomonadota bacterium]